MNHLTQLTRSPTRQSRTAHVRDDGKGFSGQYLSNNKRTGAIGQDMRASPLISAHSNGYVRQ
jgi:hypothetical protein